MAPFSIPAPIIMPLRLPVFGGSKSIDTNTKIELLCETYLQCEIFYTLDGTKPQPYVAIVQGSKTFKYSFPFCLPAGKITVRAIAVNANIHSMCSSVVTKRFEVIKTDPVNIPNFHTKRKKKKTLKSRSCSTDELFDVTDEEPLCGSSPFEDQFQNFHFEEAFIDTDNTEGENRDNNVDLHYSEEPDKKIANEKISGKKNGEKNPDDISDTLKEFLKEEIRCKNECSKIDREVVNPSPLSEAKFCCVKCDVTLQQCSSCNKLNAVSSKFCIECGNQLAKVCRKCSNDNPSMAQFCQHCGLKLDHIFLGEQDGSAFHTKVDHVDSGVMVKPQLKSASVQKLPTVISKSSQTTPQKNVVKKDASKFDLKQISRKSPGRGYWHQQLDYICNHLKTYAYNNLDFRKTISEPVLSDFQGAYVAKNENNITVSLNFTPLVLVDKNIPTAPDDINKKTLAAECSSMNDVPGC